MQTIRSNHHTGLFRNRSAAPGPAPDAGDPVTLHENLLYQEAFPHLGASGYRSINQYCIQYPASRTVSLGYIPGGRGSAFKSEVVARFKRAYLQVRLPNRRAVGGGDSLQQAPAFELSHASLMNVVGRHGIAGESGPVHQQYPVALPGQKHGSWGTSAAGANNNGIVHGILPSLNLDLIVPSRNLEDIVPFILSPKDGQWAYLHPIKKADSDIGLR
jgi:hypothetical protein